MPDRQNWVVNHQRNSHDQALNLLGEYSMFVLLWTEADLREGRVQGCRRCRVDEATMSAYGQSRQTKCPSCFGTTFEGGYRAKIIRQALWDVTSPILREEATRGQATVRTATVQSTSDFRMNVGDWVLRADGSRWQVQSVGTNVLHTGFESLSPGEAEMGYNYGSLVEEPSNGAAFLVPPSTTDLRAMLDRSFVRYPIDWSSEEEVRGALA